MSVRGRSFTGPKSIVGGGGPFAHQNPVFLRRPPTLLLPRGCLEFFGHWDRSEFRDRTFDLLITQPEIRLRIFLTPLSTLKAFQAS
jgi:hypothetical protein